MERKREKRKGGGKRRGKNEEEKKSTSHSGLESVTFYSTAYCLPPQGRIACTTYPSQISILMT